MIELLLNAENALALGLLDQAERTYRQVLEADPRNGIAAVGLARVALERGEEARALLLAQEAAAMDPENATARRMIDRMEEVARYRDAGAAAPADAGAGGTAVRRRGATAPADAGAGGTAVADAGATAPADAGTTGPAVAEAGAAAPADAGAGDPAVPMPPGEIHPPDPRPGLLRRLLRRS